MVVGWINLNNLHMKQEKETDERETKDIIKEKKQMKGMLVPLLIQGPGETKYIIKENKHMKGMLVPSIIQGPWETKYFIRENKHYAGSLTYTGTWGNQRYY